MDGPANGRIPPTATSSIAFRNDRSTSQAAKRRPALPVLLSLRWQRTQHNSRRCSKDYERYIVVSHSALSALLVNKPIEILRVRDIDQRRYPLTWLFKHPAADCVCHKQERWALMRSNVQILPSLAETLVIPRSVLKWISGKKVRSLIELRWRDVWNRSHQLVTVYEGKERVANSDHTRIAKIR